MEYSIRELSALAGVSARTLRYYDEIGLLKPLYVNDAGYRYYGEKEVELLQEILFYRERDFDLKSIRKILYQDNFQVLEALEEHLLALKEKRDHMDSLIRTVKQTIASMKGEYEMSDLEKFKAFKEKSIKENEEKYGSELRTKYGDAVIDDSNRKLMDMSRTEWEDFQKLETEIRTRLQNGVTAGLKAESEEAKEIVILHRSWLERSWKEYTVAAHKGTAKMYLCDERFKQYYDKEVEGCAKLLADAVEYWAGRI